MNGQARQLDNRPTRSGPRPSASACWAALVCLFAATTAVAADRVTLRGEALVEAPTVALADIAVLEGDRAEALADVTVARFDDARADRLTLNRREIRAELNQRGVNWGFLSLRGSIDVTIRRRVKQDETNADRGAAQEAASDVAGVTADDEAADPVAGGEPARANPVPQTISVDAESAPPVDDEPTDARTLETLVRDWIVARSGIDADALRIGWGETDAELRALRAAAGHLELDPHTRDPLGRLPLTVRHYEGDRLVNAHRFTLDVAASLPALTATRPLTRGQTITGEEVTRRTVRIDSMRTSPLSNLDRVIGQVAARSIPAGSVLETGDVRAPDLVRRGELLTIRALSGGLVLKTVARAMEAGQRDQVIRVRHPKSREIMHVRVSGPQEAVMLVGAGEPGSPSDSTTSGGGDS